MAFRSVRQTFDKDKERKYDRQLRLWGDHGQQALENAHVCLINASATGTEILKNLVLPGIGAFTILDGSKVSGEDIGNNFFLDKSSIGESRSETAMNLIQELNSDVSGNFVEKSVEQVLDKEPAFFQKFTVVITTQLPQGAMLRLAARLWEGGVPLLVCRTYGMTGYVRVALREHPVVESHPDDTLHDLRLDRPFPALVRHLSSYGDLAGLDRKEHSHTPWLVVVAKFLDVWRSQHDGSLPKNYKEKDQFKELIRQGMMRGEYGASPIEENFEEAIKNTTTALNATRIPDDIRQLFNDPSCQSLSAESADFWVLVRALCDFVEAEGEGALPLRGSIPDMVADSDKFVRLQNVYREKAKQDADAVGKRAASLLQSLGRPVDSISEGDVRLFCKHAAFLRVVRCRSLADEYNPKTALTDDLGGRVESGEGDAVLYVMLRAVDRFHQQSGRYPGVRGEEVAGDAVALRGCVSALLREWGLGCTTVKDEYIHEFCRYGAAEPHTVASFIGGAAAQEAIKLITHQFVPFNDTFVYNAMAQTSLTMRL